MAFWVSHSLLCLVLAMFHNNISSFWTRGLGSVHKMNPEFLINPERWRRCLPKTLHFSWNIFANFLSNSRRKCERTQDFHMFQNINNLLFSFHTKYSAARTWFQNVKLKKMTPGCPTSGCLPLNLNVLSTKDKISFRDKDVCSFAFAPSSKDLRMI